MIKVGRIAVYGAVALLAGSLCRPAAGSLADWHVSPGGSSFNTGQYANWLPYGGTNPNTASHAVSGLTNGINWTIWDGFGPHGNPAVGTQHNIWDFGGQQFDVKAMYARDDAQNLYVGIVTGFNPAGVLEVHEGTPVWYYAGDLAIDPDWSHGTSRLGVILPAAPAGSTAATPVYAGGTWTTPTPDFAPPPYTTYGSGGAPAGSATYSYSNLGISYYDAATKANEATFLYEVTIPRSALGVADGSTVGLSWCITCDNDWLTLSHTLTAQTGSLVAPEPGGLAALALSALLLRRRKARQ